MRGKRHVTDYENERELRPQPGMTVKLIGMTPGGSIYENTFVIESVNNSDQLLLIAPTGTRYIWNYTIRMGTLNVSGQRRTIAWECFLELVDLGPRRHYYRAVTYQVSRWLTLTVNEHVDRSADYSYSGMNPDDPHGHPWMNRTYKTKDYKTALKKVASFLRRKGWKVTEATVRSDWYEYE